MLKSIATLPYWEVECDNNGSVVADSVLVADFAVSGVRDLFFFSHGWNNSFGGARDLYQDMYTKIAGMLTPEQLRATGFVGVLWPSLLFPDDGPPDVGQRAGAASAEGGPAAVEAMAAPIASPAPTDSPAAPPDPATGAELAAALAHAFPGQEADLQRLGSLLDSQPQDGAALDEFYRLATGLVTTDETGGPEDNGERGVPKATPREALQAVAGPPGAPGAPPAPSLFGHVLHRPLA